MCILLPGTKILGIDDLPVNVLPRLIPIHWAHCYSKLVEFTAIGWKTIADLINLFLGSAELINALNLINGKSQ